MKKTLKMMAVAMLALALFACGGNTKKLTHDDMKKAEAMLFNEDQSLNREAAPQVAETYCEFVKQNPDDAEASMWLYHAMEINVELENADKSIALGNQLVEQYPDSEWAPMSLFLLASYVYNDQLNDTAQAHATFQKLIDDYPNHSLVDDAEKSIEYLGLTPEEIMTLIMMSQFEEDEEDL